MFSAVVGMSSTYMKDGKEYWEWRYGAKKVLEYIAYLRDLDHRFHYDEDCRYESDKHLVETLIREIKIYRLWLEERDNPIEVK